MKLNKKGSLDLSINAIVILILAITMLGLGLAFMRNIFGTATQEFEEVGGTVQKQMIDPMKETDKIVDITNPKLEMKAGEQKQIFLGFKNEGNNDVDFQIRQIEVSFLGGAAETTNIYDISNESAVIKSLGSGDVCGVRDDSGVSTDVYIEFKSSQTTVRTGDVVVVPINIITTSAAEQATCTYEIKIDIDADTGAPIDYSEIIELTIDVVN